MDNQEGVKEPVGMSGVRLEADVHIITGAVTSAQNIYRCVKRTGISVRDLVLEPLASSYAVLTQDENGFLLQPLLETDLLGGTRPSSGNGFQLGKVGIERVHHVGHGPGILIPKTLIRLVPRLRDRAKELFSPLLVGQG